MLVSNRRVSLILYLFFMIQTYKHSCILIKVDKSEIRGICITHCEFRAVGTTDYSSACCLFKKIIVKKEKTSV